MRGRLLLALVLSACGASPGLRPPPIARPTDADAAALGLSASVDRTRGLVLVIRVEDPSDGEAGPRPASGHLCVPSEIDAVSAQLSDYVSDRRANGIPTAWSCEEDRCELRGQMEFDPMRALRFSRAPDGSLFVSALEIFGDAGSSEDYLGVLREQVDDEVDALLGPCP